MNLSESNRFKYLSSEHQFTSVLYATGGATNETDYMTIVVKSKNYVPSKEDTVSLTAGIVMVVLMLFLVAFFVVLYRNDDIIAGKYNQKILGAATQQQQQQRGSTEKVPGGGVVNGGLVVGEMDVRMVGKQQQPQNATTTTTTGGVCEMHEISLYSSEDEVEDNPPRKVKAATA